MEILDRRGNNKKMYNFKYFFVLFVIAMSKNGFYFTRFVCEELPT